MNSIKAVVFDMDGVLFDTERLCTSCWYESAEAMKLGDVSQAVTDCVGLNRNDIKSILDNLYGKDFPYEKYMEAISARMKDKIQENGLPLKEGACEILEYLKQKDCKIALASSSRQSTVFGHLDRSGLRKYFPVIIGGDMVPHSKPKPDIYLMACREIGVEPFEAIAIEDSPNGIKSAFAAGMKTIMVPDLISPTEEIETMLYKKFDSLLDVINFLADENIL